MPKSIFKMVDSGSEDSADSSVTFLLQTCYKKSDPIKQNEQF